MKPIGIIPGRLVYGRWVDNRYDMLYYSGVMSNILSMPGILRSIRRTLMTTDL